LLRFIFNKHPQIKKKASSTPGPIAFTLIDFPHTNDAEMEIASVLEQRLVDVNDDVQFFSARKEMLLTFDSANDAHTGCMFSDDIKLTSLAGAYKKFIDICAEGLPWAICGAKSGYHSKERCLSLSFCLSLSLSLLFFLSVSLFLSPSLSPLSLSCALSLSHAHTHTHSLSIDLSLSFFLFLSLSLSLSHTHTHSLSLTHTLSL